MVLFKDSFFDVLFFPKLKSLLEISKYVFFFYKMLYSFLKQLQRNEI